MKRNISTTKREFPEEVTGNETIANTLWPSPWLWCVTSNGSVGWSTTFAHNISHSQRMNPNFSSSNPPEVDICCWQRTYHTEMLSLKNKRSTLLLHDDLVFVCTSKHVRHAVDSRKFPAACTFRKNNRLSKHKMWLAFLLAFNPNTVLFILNVCTKE